MKAKLLIFLALLLLFPLEPNAQHKTDKVRTYRVWITLIDGSVKKGILYSANARGLEIMNGTTIDISNIIFIEANKINVIKLRRRGKVGIGAGIGAVAGITAGAIYGSSTREEEGFMSELGNSLNTSFGILMFGSLGTGIGAVAGSSKKVFQINNHLEIYEEQLPIIQTYALKSKE